MNRENIRLASKLDDQIKETENLLQVIDRAKKDPIKLVSNLFGDDEWRNVRRDKKELAFIIIDPIVDHLRKKIQKLEKEIDAL